MDYISKNCLGCKREFKFSKSNKSKTCIKNRKFCSLKCFYKSPNFKGFKNGHKRNTGKNNGKWLGYNYKFKNLTGLHYWVKRNWKNPPKLCQMCHKKPSYDLANKGIYNRDFKNWEWLCRRCHMEKDGRLKKFIKNKNGK